MLDRRGPVVVVVIGPLRRRRPPSQLRTSHRLRGQPGGQARDAPTVGAVHVAAVHKRLQVRRPMRRGHVRDRSVRVVRRGAAEKRQLGREIRYVYPISVVWWYLALRVT